MMTNVFLLLFVAFVAAVFGFSGIAGTASWMAQVLFVIALVLFFASLFTKKGSCEKSSCSSGLS